MDSSSGPSISPEQALAARCRCRQRSSCPFCDTDGADRISGLPDNVLLRILAGVRCARTAALAGGLSRRWRGLWRRLPEVHLYGLAPDAVVAALEQVALPELYVLDINVPKRFKFSAASVASLLRTAARLAPVELTIKVWGDGKAIGIAVELPCFDRATSIKLQLEDVKIEPAAAGGEFSLLKRLSVTGCRLSTASLILQCPNLRVLELRRCFHPDVLRVHSTKIEELLIVGDAGGAGSWLGSVDIVAPVLKKFTMDTAIYRDFSMSFSAPMTEVLSWRCGFSGSTVAINGLWSLMSLKLSKRKTGYFLNLDLYISDNTLYERNLQEIVQLPDISVFKICILSRGHRFGSMVMNLLGMFTAIRSLKLELERIMEMIGFKACGPNCHCDHQQNWRSQNITLTNLKEVEIKNFEAREDEVNLLKLVFGCAPLLKRVILRVSPGISPRELEWKEICNLFKANPSVRPYVYDACGEKMEYNSKYNTMRFYDDDDWSS